MQGDFSHSLAGIFLFSVPVTFLLAIIFHGLVRAPVVGQLPTYFKRRALAVAPPEDWLAYLRRNWHSFSLSAVLGATSHILWDSFTHQKAFFVQRFPVLLTPVSWLGLTLPMCRWIQHLSTLIGFIFLFLYISRLATVPLHKQPAQQAWWVFWLKVFLLGCSFLILNMLTRIAPDMSLHMIGLIVPTLISGCLLALVLMSFAAKATSRLN